VKISVSYIGDIRMILFDLKLQEITILTNSEGAESKVVTATVKGVDLITDQ
jgi:hypothetical protein